jgi:hypothetical protein
MGGINALLEVAVKAREEIGIYMCIYMCIFHMSIHIYVCTYKHLNMYMYINKDIMPY